MAANEAPDPDGTALFHEAMPFTKRLGIEVVTSTKELVRARIAWEASLCTIGGILHGGVLMSLADATGAMCAFLNLPGGAQGTTTIESHTHFLRPVREGFATASARALQAGRRVIVVETEIHGGGGKRVAKVTQSQAVV
ncbi:PaaI family thioesterase [Saccharomonospora sp. NPDC006951]